MELNVEEALRYLGAGSGAPADLREKTEETARWPNLTLDPGRTKTYDSRSAFGTVW